MIASQVVEKIFLEQTCAAQIVDVVIIKRKFLNIINDLFQTCRNGKSIVTGILAEEGVKNNDLFDIFFKITLHHRQLV